MRRTTGDVTTRLTWGFAARTLGYLRPANPRPSTNHVLRMEEIVEGVKRACETGWMDLRAPRFGLDVVRAKATPSEGDETPGPTSSMTLAAT